MKLLYALILHHLNLTQSVYNNYENLAKFASQKNLLLYSHYHRINNYTFQGYYHHHCYSIGTFRPCNYGQQYYYRRLHFPKKYHHRDPGPNY